MAGGVRLSIRDSGPIKIIEQANFELTVGIHENEGRDMHGNSGFTVAQVAEANEFGAGRIPARSFLRRWADEQGKHYINDLKQALISMVKGQNFTDPAPIEEVADNVRDSMKTLILSGSITPPNSPVTLLRKQPEDRPLVDTGQMVDAIMAHVHADSPLNWDYDT